MFEGVCGRSRGHRNSRNGIHVCRPPRGLGRARGSFSLHLVGGSCRESGAKGPQKPAADTRLSLVALVAQCRPFSPFRLNRHKKEALCVLEVGWVCLKISGSRPLGVPEGECLPSRKEELWAPNGTPKWAVWFPLGPPLTLTTRRVTFKGDNSIVTIKPDTERVNPCT